MTDVQAHANLVFNENDSPLYRLPDDVVRTSSADVRV